MENLRRLSWIAVLLLVTISCSHVVKDVRPDKLVDLTPESTVLGPEAFPFCGGWVELWAQARSGRPTRVLLKASPPAGASWVIRNAFIVVEGMGSSGQPLRFTEAQNVEVSSGRAVISEWPLASEVLNPQNGLKTALKPFDGCAGQQGVRGVVLKSRLDPVTL